MTNLTNKQKESKTRKAEKLMNQALELMEEVKRSERNNFNQQVDNTFSHLEMAAKQVEHLSFEDN